MMLNKMMVIVNLIRSGMTLDQIAETLRINKQEIEKAMPIINRMGTEKI